MANDDTGTSRTPVRGPSPDDPTIGRLVADASRDISTLVSKEIALAKSELKVSVKAGGIGIGLLAGAAFIAVLGVIMLSFTIVYFIHWARPRAALGLPDRHRASGSSSPPCWAGSA